MASIGVRLPLVKDSADGFGMIKTIKGMIKQNFKMLLLTIPGERIMEPNFGVGIIQFLFSNYSEGAEVEIRERISSQVRTYMPIISVESIEFSSDPDSSLLQMNVTYKIPRLGTRDLLEITI